jgi:hypothetical protein
VGGLTESMTRLRGEIGAWRHRRVALHDALVKATDRRRTQVSALCADFAGDRAGARRAWLGGTPPQPLAVKRLQPEHIEEIRTAARLHPQPAAPAPAATVAQKPKPVRKGSKKR